MQISVRLASRRSFRGGKIYRIRNHIEEDGRAPTEQKHYGMLHARPVTLSYMFVQLVIHGEQVSIDIDTGSSITILNKTMWWTIGSPRLTAEAAILRSFSGHPIKLLGEAEVKFDTDRRSVGFVGLSPKKAEAFCVGTEYSHRAFANLVYKSCKVG